MRLIFSLSLLLLASNTCFAGAGGLDYSFNPGSGPNDDVFVLRELHDGRIACGGVFTNYDGVIRSGISLLHVDGSVDASFDPAAGFNSSLVLAMVQQNDGRLIVGGWFTNFNGTPARGLARLHLNGSLDPSFNVGFGASGAFGITVSSIGLDPMGRVFVGGLFTNFSGVPSSLVRLQTNGTVDPTFNCQVQGVFSVVPTIDGGAIIGGAFTNVNGISARYVTRLLSDGQIDPSFQPAGGPSDSVFESKLYPDGRILIRGAFTNVDSSPRSRMARLLANGQVDPDFNPPPSISSLSFERMAIDPLERIIVEEESLNRLIRLNSTGTVDPTFISPTNLDQARPLIQADGRILVGGSFSITEGTNLIRLHGDSTRSNQISSLAATFDSTAIPTNAALQSISTTTNRRVIVTGQFQNVSGVPYAGIARFNTNGLLDQTFDPGDGIPAPGLLGPWADVLKDGKLLVYGMFSQFNNVQRARIARLMPNGALDTNFASPGGTGSGIFDVAADELTGGVYLFGNRTYTVNGHSAAGVVRLNTNGALDMAFDPGAGTRYQLQGGTVFSGAIQRDGKVLIGGVFDQVGSTPRQNLARLQSNGSLDTSLRSVTMTETNADPDSAILAVLLLPDERILIGGNFNSVNGQPRNGIARLLQNGAVDMDFDPGRGFEGGSVGAIALESSGQVIVAGNFIRADGARRTGLARLNHDGSLDRHFNPRLTAGASAASISHISFYSDGTLFALGNFNRVNETNKARFVALYPGPQRPRMSIGKNGDFPELAVHHYAGEFFRIETAPEVTGPWQLLMTNQLSLSGNFYSNAPAFTSAPRSFFRAIHVGP